jgi:hypothetical protein
MVAGRLPARVVARSTRVAPTRAELARTSTGRIVRASRNTGCHARAISPPLHRAPRRRLLPGRDGWVPLGAKEKWREPPGSYRSRNEVSPTSALLDERRFAMHTLARDGDPNRVLASSLRRPPALFPQNHSESVNVERRG